MIDRLHQMLVPWFPAIPVAVQAELDRALIHSNLLRLRVMAWALVVAMPVLAGIDRRSLEEIGTPAAAALQSELLALRLAWIGSALAFLAAGRPPGTPDGVARRHRLGEAALIPSWLILAAIHCALGHPVSVSIAAYLLAVFITAAFLHLNGWKSLAAYGSAWAAFLLALATLHYGGDAVGRDLINGTLMTVLAIVVSRIIYVTRVRDFLSQRVIERQRIELERANKELAESNAVLRRVSFLDPLTGVPNRRYFDDYLAREWRRAARDGSSLALIMIDIDHFKQFNDCYGHQSGDSCLVGIAAAIGGVSERPADLSARYGGDEFAVVLPETDLEGACHVAEQIRVAVEELGIPHSGSPLGHATVSLGVAGLQPVRDQPLDCLVAAADEALYGAKAEGRNRCVVAPRGG